MICNSALSRAINEIGERQPGRIFDKCRDLVIESFSKSTDEVQDGMDASLGMINLETRTLKWAGANSPLWIYRSNLKCIEIVLPDKQPIGKVDSPKSFTTRTFQLNENDVVYLFTDGYADQFGGSKNKKLTKKKFQEFLLSIADKSLDVQKIMLIDFHNSYKGNLEQVDDICVIGFKLT
jgi:serine phosphatase RsbU (regulator of sigma subunit)